MRVSVCVYGQMKTNVETKKRKKKKNPIGRSNYLLYFTLTMLLFFHSFLTHDKNEWIPTVIENEDKTTTRQQFCCKMENS